MTGNPVAAANARTMWKRETPPTPAISSSVNGCARWLSIYQSAFWAGFMDHGLHSKRPHHARLRRASFDSPCSHPRALGNAVSSAERKLATLVTCSQSCILQSCIDPTAHFKLPHNEDCMSLGQHVREDDDALPCLEPSHIRMPCGTSSGRGRKFSQRPEE